MPRPLPTPRRNSTACGGDIRVLFFLNTDVSGCLSWWQIYDETLKLCGERQGPISPTMAKLYFNKAIVYEDEAKETDDTETYGRAYDCYKKAFVVSRQVLGVEHSKTVRYRRKLAEPRYKWFSDRRRENINALDTDQVLRITASSSS